MEKQVMTPASKGLIIAVALILISVVITITQQEGNRSLGLIPIALFLGGIIWACLSYAKQMDGNVTFGNIFSHGFKASALVAALVSFWVVLSLTVFFPESLDRMLEVQRLEMIKKGMSEGDIDNALAMGHKAAVPFGTIFSVIIYLVLGAIASVVGAAVSKKNPNPVFPDKLGN